MTLATTAELACQIDLSAQRTRELARKGVLVRKGRGSFELEASVIAYIRHLREIAAARTSDDGAVDAVLEGALLKRSQRRLNEIKQGEAEGRLIPVEVLQPAWNRVAIALQSSVMAIPGRARSSLPHLTLHDGETLDQLCRDALENAGATMKAPDVGQVAGNEPEDEEDDR